jgi:hypothetical protein
MKIERETDHDETTQALTDTIADALASADKADSVITNCSDGLSRVQLRVGTRRFELRLVEVL